MANRRNTLFYYSPFNFIRELKTAPQLELLTQARISGKPYLGVETPAGECCFYLEALAWDTAYFGLRTHKLQAVLYPKVSLAELAQACRTLVQHLADIGSQYCFLEIPAEDILLIQALGIAGFKLVETRLTYYQNLTEYSHPERFAVRRATEADTDDLQHVARTMRNSFDRFHADPIFSPEKADEFLATYVQQSIRGFADVVLVPDCPGEAPGAFLTANYQRELWPALGLPVAKMVLSAVSGASRQGWYKKLISEMSYHLREQGAVYAFMNTQATNRAVFHTWESLGYRLGGTTHILSYSPGLEQIRSQCT
ncbi:hypothetical protein GCM10023185_16560 [Hymenobacter saemangeumensis]|uniref:N-acetyltransferase domain-containing protein n=1 Tax=Hymenobacter saemangeumensis TaxID=1084522 RepID=A0ABP8IAB2_9BACT